MLYTDGVRHVATAGRAHWLIDEIMFAQRFVPEVAAEAFQLWKLELMPDCSAALSCRGGNGNVVWTKEIGFSDFPLDAITSYFTNRIMLLPSEY